jgi:hypothetical protein
VRLAKNVHAISRLVFILSLVIAFLIGALLSYIFTMGFYAPNEFNLPSKASLTIERVQFFSQSTDFFNVTVLNPSYSPSDATVEQIKVATNDGIIHLANSTLPALPQVVASGKTQTFKSFWNWANYTGQTVDVILIIDQGSGPAVEAETGFMNLTITSIAFEPSVTVTRFNVTVASMSSPISVDINRILINGQAYNTTPTLPYMLKSNGSSTFTLYRNWTDVQGKPVSIAVQTEQGYAAYKTAIAPQVTLNVSNIRFYNTTATDFFFNVTVRNSAYPSARVNISLLTVYAEGQNITITDVAPSLSPSLDLEPLTPLVLQCRWDWTAYKNENATITIYTVQGFKASAETTVNYSS